MPTITHAQRLATRAAKHELQREVTPEELQPLRVDARRMLDHDRSDAFIRGRLERRLDRSPEGQAVNQAIGSSQALLGHAPDAALLVQARTLLAEGKTTAEIRSTLDAAIQAGPEYRKLHAGETVDNAYELALQRAPNTDELMKGVNWAHELIDQGKTPEEVQGAFAWVLGISAEARKLHAADNVNAVYAWTMGRAPSPEELTKSVEIAGQLIDQGKNNDEVNGVLDYLCKLSPEWQAKHPQMNHDRDAIYMHQPNGWTCGPTSLAMAMAAAGKRAPNEDTIWEMAQPDKLNTIANQSTDKMPDQIAEIARSMGVNAEGHIQGHAGDIRAALEAGHGTVVNGTNGGGGGHFIYLSGVDEAGQIVVCDPWHPEITRWNDDQLEYFTRNGPGPGNFVEIWP